MNSIRIAKNIVGGGLEILFYFPNDWDKNIEGKIEIIKVYFLPLPKIAILTILVYFLVKAKNKF